MSSEFAKTEKNNLGVRLLRAFADGANITDKREIAAKLGYKSDKVIYKIINGEQEMGFGNLLRFRESTGHSIDWLLYGDGWVPEHDEVISTRLLLGNLQRNDLERLWRQEVAAGRNIDFLVFLSELIAKGVTSVRGQDFDLERSIEMCDDWMDVLKMWYEFEGGEMPGIEGASFMRGWESFETTQQKAAAIRDLKTLLDRTADLYQTASGRKESGGVVASIEPGRVVSSATETVNRDIEYIREGKKTGGRRQ